MSTAHPVPFSKSADHWGNNQQNRRKPFNDPLPNAAYGPSKVLETDFC